MILRNKFKLITSGALLVIRFQPDFVLLTTTLWAWQFSLISVHLTGHVRKDHLVHGSQGTRWGFEASWILFPDGNDISSKLFSLRLFWPFQGCWMWPCTDIDLSALGELHWVPWACVCPVAHQSDPPPPRLNLSCSRLSHSSQVPGIAQCSILYSKDQGKREGIESLKSFLFFAFRFFASFDRKNSTVANTNSFRDSKTKTC